MDAKDIRRKLKRETGCRRRNIKVFDKFYTPLTLSVLRASISNYKKDPYVPENWDCDNIARDFVNYVQKRIKNTENKNAAIGIIVVPESRKEDHVQEVFMLDTMSQDVRRRYKVQYLDHRDWKIYAPNRRPKWTLI